MVWLSVVAWLNTSKVLSPVPAGRCLSPSRDLCCMSHLDLSGMRCVCVCVCVCVCYSNFTHKKISENLLYIINKYEAWLVCCYIALCMCMCQRNCKVSKLSHMHAVSHGQAVLGEAEPDNPVCLAGSEQEETGSHYTGRGPSAHILHLTHETCSTAVWWVNLSSAQRTSSFLVYVMHGVFLVLLWWAM